MKEALFLEKSIVKSVIDPVNLGTAANTGARIDMSKLKRLTFILVLAGSGNTSAHSIALKQHTLASGGTTAALSVDNPYFHKIGAATSFTKVSPTVAADTYDLHAVIGDAAGVVVFEVLQEQLSEGYGFVSLDIADVGTTHLGAVIAIGHEVTEAPIYSKVV